jgi:hypothetical protein
LQLVKKKLKSGTVTGDILDAVIAGKDGPIDEKAKSSLTRLQSLARLSNNNNDECGGKYTAQKMCRHCEKLESLGGAKLMECQRCKVTYYCNKDCQVADWKIHKRSCNDCVVSRSTIKTSHAITFAFIKSNYFDIAKELYKKTQEYKVPKKELFVELDFHGDGPALRNEFKVWLTSDFIEGLSLADAPCWLRTNYEQGALPRYLREQYEKVTSDDLLVVTRAGNGIVPVLVLRLPVAGTDYQYLSDESVESIGREDYDGMAACLGQHLTAAYFREKKTGFA